MRGGGLVFAHVLALGGVAAADVPAAEADPQVQPGQTVGEALLAALGVARRDQLLGTLAEAQLALETAVAIRDKVVEAYQDILRMPV